MMRWEVSWKRVTAILASLLLPLLLIMGGYYLMIQPLKQQVSQVHQEIQTEEKLLAVIQQKDQKVDEVVRSTVQLQGKVPVAPLVDQILLRFDEAAIVTDSSIQAYAFNDEDQSVESSLEERTKPKTFELQNPLERIEEQNQGETPSTDAAPLPQGIKRVTANLSVASPNYVQLEQFLTRLEKQKRITTVQSLSFTGNPEVLNVDDGDQLDLKKEVSYQVQVSTFYAPELQELIKDLPYVKYPAPGKRTNPLSIYLEEVSDE